MTVRRFLALVFAVTAAGCGGGQSIETDPVPEGSVTAPESGTMATLNVPSTHLPPAGMCRVWDPTLSPGQQRGLPSGACNGMAKLVGRGQWVLYRPDDDNSVVEVRMFDTVGSAGLQPVLIRVFNIATGQLVKEIVP